MAKELFENIQNKKQKLYSLLSKAKEYHWLSDGEFTEYSTKLDNDVLTIGVIGQMKAGKSTFLNAFVFEDDVLPAATTPMTAALTVITYGEKKLLSAEFYTENEWQEQLLTSQMPIQDGMTESQLSKIKAAKELVEKSAAIKNEMHSLLGKTVEDDFERLIEYVGADGKYVSITKSVKIFYPKEYLKGVRIVDTPGFNDPIVSREERTKEFLKEADVVLLMLYAGRPFDSTDREILFKDVAQCGMGKVLIGINKYDIPYCNGETEMDIKRYVEDEIHKASSLMGNEQLNDILKEMEPIPLSAEMALMGFLPMSKIMNDESYQEKWRKRCDDFGITTQTEMVEKSHIGNLVEAVKIVIEKEKDAVLYRKPINAILSKGQTIAQQTDAEILKTDELIKNLSLPDYELEEKSESLSKTKRRLSRKIDSLGDDLDEGFTEIIRKGCIQLEDDVDDACKKMTKIVDNWGRFESVDKVLPKINQEIECLATRTLKRDIEEIQDTSSRKIKSVLQDFFDKVSELLSRVDFGDEFDSEEFVQRVSRKYKIDDPEQDLFTVSEAEEDEVSWGDIALDFINNFVKGYTFGLSDLLGKALAHDSQAAELKEFISSKSANFDAKAYLSHIVDSKKLIIGGVSNEFIENLLNPLIEQVTNVKEKLSNKESAKEDAMKKLMQLKKQKEATKEQMDEIQQLMKA